MASQRVAVVGVGATTSIGHDARTACASFRAGIVRPVELDYFEAFSDSENDLIPVVGHAATLDGVEAEALGKILTLGAHALMDVAAHALTSNAAHGLSTGLYVALPNPSLRRGPYVDLRNVGSSVPAQLEPDHPAWPSIAFAAQCNAHLESRMLRAAGLNLQCSARQHLFGDHVAFLLAVAAAMRDLESGKVQRCLVGGIDSYLDPDTLEWALESDRLKTEAQPCGFAPGEAAVFLELMSPELAAASHISVKGYLSAPHFEREPLSAEPDTSPQGQGSAAVVKKALQAQPQANVHLIIGDLNGEVGRAQDWGYALNRLVADFPGLGAARSWFPATSFGDTGCASSALALAIGLQAFERNYARSDDILVLSSSDAGPRAAAILSRYA